MLLEAEICNHELVKTNSAGQSWGSTGVPNERCMHDQQTKVFMVPAKVSCVRWTLIRLRMNVRGRKLGFC